MESASFYTHRGKAAALAALLSVFAAGCAAVLFLPDATPGARLAGASTAALFGWGVALALVRLIDGRAALVIDNWGVHDRRMKIDAPWSSIRSAGVWVQELDAARSTWIALDVDVVEEVRAIPALWARVRRATLERWGRPPVALNLQGLNASTEDVLAAISRFKPGVTDQGEP